MDASPSRVLPVSVQTITSVRAELSEGFRAVSGNKLQDAQAVFRHCLEALLLVSVSSDTEAKDVSKPEFKVANHYTDYRSGEIWSLCVANICWACPLSWRGDM